MAGEKEAEAKAEVKTERKNGDTFGMKKILLLVFGALLVFLGSVPLHLYLNGVLSLSSPHMKAIPGYASVDSILVVERARVQAEMEAKAREEEALEQQAKRSRAPAPDAGDAVVKPPEASAGQAGDEPGGAAPAGEVPLEAEAEPPAAGEDDRVSGARADAGTAVAEPDPLLPFDPEQMSRLVTVYEKMRPKQVALILSTMPERQAVTILNGMKNQSAAKVLAEMEPARAARISELLVRWENHAE